MVQRLQVVLLKLFPPNLVKLLLGILPLLLFRFQSSKIRKKRNTVSPFRVLSTGGGGGEASTPSTIPSPPKHNYELIIIHVFVSF